MKKLRRPPVAADFVCRARLHAELDAERHFRLTLATATLGPAFGTHPLRSTESVT